MKDVLIIEDDPVLNRFLSQHARDMQLQVSSCQSWSAVDQYLQGHEPALIVSDMRLPDGELAHRLPQLVELCPVIVLTAYGSIRGAVDAMKAGASEYLTKPVSPEELTLVIRKVLDTAKLRMDHQYCKRRLKATEGAFSYMIGESAALQEVQKMVEAVATSDMTVLIHGESPFVITTPPLRDRREDIPHLVQHFLDKHGFSSRINKKVAQAAMRTLIAHEWPGNIRELKNAVERAVILSRGKPRIGVEHLGFLHRRGSEASLRLEFDHDPSLEEIEARYLEQQLRKFAGHRSQVAQVLGISERNVYRLIKRYGLTEVAG
jgi:DNA-binding NtrC family response regulator